ncbi:Cyclic AMP-responsive element-binding protein 5-like isoform X1 [Oopsacas minuta]|uniref:Cyclic AMP-responsive element-binding protein 5-like isoform X1 n=1 Tax=Oopsacas minuta TaxID=111878 RepID=A0AAV7JAL9_9METZ|nr:Cyclic AMP-responsive element-binding protein 5-like isoform X1 [Oopsacas minuta]
MSTSSIESIDITTTPTPTTKRNSTFSDELQKFDFTCQMPRCEERFNTAEEYAIHQQQHKHEMKLRIGGELSFMDDTPTPTRFLRLIGANEYQEHNHPSPFDPLFKKVTDDNCDTLAMSIAKDRRYLNEMIPNGLQTIPNESQHDSNISTSSSSTIYGPNTSNEYSSDIPFPRGQLSIDENVCPQIGYAQELSGDSSSLLLQHKTSSSDSLQSDSISTTASASHDTTMSMTGIPIKKKRGRKPILDEDPVEKRKRYLERNRAAATRCRNKKKIWVTGLEKHINSLVDEVDHLKGENTMLKAELRQYRQFKDPLTNFVHLRSLNEEDNHDRLTGYLSAAPINTSSSISQGNILRTHPNLLLPMSAASWNPELNSSSHLPSTTNQ